MAVKKVKKVEYWTWWANQCCSIHKTKAAAVRAAEKCERAGGGDHEILKVERVNRPSANGLRRAE